MLPYQERSRRQTGGYNLNITGRFELVITDARRQEEEITGSKPKRVVTPEDIGLPTAPARRSGVDSTGTMLTDDGPASARLVLVADTGSDEQALIQRMAAPASADRVHAR